MALDISPKQFYQLLPGIVQQALTKTQVDNRLKGNQQRKLIGAYNKLGGQPYSNFSDGTLVCRFTYSTEFPPI